MGESRISLFEVEKSALNLFFIGRQKRKLLAFSAGIGKSIVIESLEMWFTKPEGLLRFGIVVHLIFSVYVFFKKPELNVVFNKDEFSLSWTLSV